MKRKVIQERKTFLNRKIGRIYFHLKLTMTFSLQISTTEFIHLWDWLWVQDTNIQI